MRISLLCNSQGTAANGVPLNAHYPFLLRKLLMDEHEIHGMLMSGWSIVDFNDRLDSVFFAEPELVILQVGIVECSPRILSRREKAVIGALPYHMTLTGWLHRRRNRVIEVRRRLGITTRLVEPDEFERLLSDFLTKMDSHGIRLLVAEIPRFPTEHEERHFPSGNNHIDEYNEIIRTFDSLSMLDEDTNSPELWIPGTVHFTRKGHEATASTLAQAIRAI